MSEIPVFLDANVIFSACYREDAGLRRLWRLDGIQLCTSLYAVEEAHENLAPGRQRAALQDLIHLIKVSPAIAPHSPALRKTYGLPPKDQPILWAAIDVQAKYLATGDIAHFGPLMNQIVEGVQIVRPATLFQLFKLKESGQAKVDTGETARDK